MILVVTGSDWYRGGEHSKVYYHKQTTLPETNIAPENGGFQ